MVKIKPAVVARLNRALGLADRLVGCWLLNEGSGQVVHDLSGSGHDGSFSGGPLWQPALLGPAVAFEGDNDWISMGNCLDLGTDDVTILALLQYSTNQPEQWEGDGIGAIAGKGYLGNNKGYGLHVAGGNRIWFQVRNQDLVAVSANSDGALNDGHWHVAVGVCDRDSTTGLRLYIDGVRQSATADPTSLAGVNLTGLEAFAIGSRQDFASMWAWDFLGQVAAVYVWKRVLTEAEIGQVYREPFALFTHRRTVAALAAPSGAITDVGGAAHGVSSSSASLQVIQGLSGSATTHARAVGVLRQAGPRRWWDETPWRREAFGNGMTANAFQLGTMLTRGWFWIRRGGAAALYRGDSLNHVDLTRILHAADGECQEIPLPTYLLHPAGSTHGYLVRRFDGGGHQEKTTTGALTVRFGPDGRLAPPAPNGVFELKGEQIYGRRLSLTWFYDPLDQETAPQQFNLYSDDATGEIDLEHPLATIPYRGRRFYRYETAPLDPGRHRFVVRPRGADAVDSRSTATVVCPVTAIDPEAPTILCAQTL